MKAKVFNLTAITFSLVLGIATAQAQTQESVVSIPFDFQVGTQHISAGQYVADIIDGYLLAIRGANTSGTAVSTNSINSKHREQESPRLVFFRLGNQYYLIQVRSPDLEDGRKISLLEESAD